MSKTTARPVLVAVLAAVAALLAACTSSAVGHSTPISPTPTGTQSSSSSSAPVISKTSAASSGNQASATCSPSGTSLQISAQNIKFSTNCLAAPAGKPFTIAFDNKDSGVPHNIEIFTNSSATKSLYKGSIVTGPKTVTYSVPALTAGTYYFRCDIHPTQMFGTFVVK